MEQYWQQYRVLGEQAEREHKYDLAESMWAMAVLLAEQIEDGRQRLAYSLDRLGSALSRGGKFKLAEMFLTRSWHLKSTVMGAAELDKAATLNLIAELCFKQKRLSEADPLCQMVLDIYTVAYGKEHPNTVGAANNLTMLRRMIETQGSAPAPSSASIIAPPAPPAQAAVPAQVSLPARVATPVPGSSANLSAVPAAATLNANSQQAVQAPPAAAAQYATGSQQAVQTPQAAGASQQYATGSQQAVQTQQAQASAQYATGSQQAVASQPAYAGGGMRQVSTAMPAAARPPGSPQPSNAPAHNFPRISPAAPPSSAEPPQAAPAPSPKPIKPTMGGRKITDYAAMPTCERCGAQMTGEDCLRCTGTTLKAISPLDKLT